MSPATMASPAVNVIRGIPLTLQFHSAAFSGAGCLATAICVLDLSVLHARLVIILTHLRTVYKYVVMELSCRPRTVTMATILIVMGVLQAVLCKNSTLA